MNHSDTTGSRKRSADFRTLDDICDRFERAIREGDRPRVEDFLEGHDASLRPSILRELLFLAVEYQSDGQPASMEEYNERFPREQDIVGEVFRAVAETDKFRESHAAKPARRAGSQMARIELSVVAGPHQGKQFVFDRHDKFVVGRGQETHFPLGNQDPLVSRVHFLVETNPPLCQIVDLGSRNGTYVNDVQISTAPLHDSDRIRVGGTEIVVTIHELDEAPTPPPAGDATENWAPANQQQPTAAPETPEGAAARFPIIDGYRIQHELGEGGMGVVYLAQREHDSSPVAIKTIRPRGEVSEREVQFFLREAYILRQLRHPNVVTFHEMGQSGPCIFFVMDYVPGIDGAQLVKKKGALKVGFAVRMISQALTALSFAHSRGFVHRDVKPSNLLIDKKDDVAKCHLADFGLARAYDTSSISGLTVMGAIGGTLPFMSPEQITDYRHVRPATDQYSMAATLYYLLTGSYLFDFGDTPMEKRIAQVLLEEPVDIRKRRRSVPKELARVIEQALAKAPADRFEDCNEFAQHLSRFGK